MHFREIDLDWLFQLRVVVARLGEADLGRWWNTDRQLGSAGGLVLRRGFPRTHHFAQARSVFAIARHRCAQVFDPPNAVTLWSLTEAIEEEFDRQWETWLDQAPHWHPFFDLVAQCESPDLVAILSQMELVGASQVDGLRELKHRSGEHMVHIPHPFAGERDVVALLALGFAKGEIGSVVVPYATRVEQWR